MRLVRRKASRAIGAAVLTCGLAAAGATATGALAQSGSAADSTRTVDYHGYSVQVPESWRVVDLRENPNACVRFDTPTVYVGMQGSQTSCSTDAVGRTAGIVIEPLNEQTSAHVLPNVVTASERSAALPESTASANGATQVAVEEAGVLVTAAHTTSTEPVVQGILRDAELTGGGEPVDLESFEQPRTGSTRQGIVAPGTFNDEAFDTCAAPDQGAMDAWRSSPYKAVGIYISGNVRACSQPNLTTDWVSTQHNNGWQFILIDVGPQSSCSGGDYEEYISEDPETAMQQGKDSAAASIAAAEGLGFAPGSAIYSDIEGYEPSSTCTTAMLSYVSGWTQVLQENGYLSGVYSSVSSGMVDLANAYEDTNYTRPDHIWFAWWNDVADTDAGEYVPDDYWAAGQRIHQYKNATESYGGVSINIDGNYADLLQGNPPPCATVSQDFAAYPDLQSGASGDELKAAQCALDAAGHKPGSTDPYEPTGQFDQPTVEATKAFQTERQLQASGTIDAHTWTALLATGEQPVLSNGASGSDVSRLQRALTAALGKTVEIDGAFGPNTEAAVKEYQQKVGLEADGVVGEQTWGALRAGK